jgi:DNA-binding NarL/FixJ family response regulator
MCIDDNLLLIDALESRLNMEPGFIAFYRGDDLATCVDRAAEVRPTVVLLDVDLPGGVDAMTLLDGIVERAPATKVLVFSGFATGDLVRRAMARGAWGFVSKGTSAERLIDAVKRVAEGQAVIELEE